VNCPFKCLFEYYDHFRHYKGYTIPVCFYSVIPLSISTTHLPREQWHINDKDNICFFLLCRTGMTGSDAFLLPQFVEVTDESSGLQPRVHYTLPKYKWQWINSTHSSVTQDSTLAHSLHSSHQV